jgi:hypothetical protein
MQQQQQQQQQETDQPVERAVDPRRQPPQEQHSEHIDPDRNFVQNGGNQWHESHSRDETSSYKDLRPNPNKHEDG